MPESNVVALPAAKPAADPLNWQLRIATGTGGFGQAKNKTTTWGNFIEKLKRPPRDGVTDAQYAKLSKDEKQKLKHKGFYIGGQFEGERRKNNRAQFKSLLTFDIDFADQKVLSDLQMGDGWIGDYEYFLHSTRSHTKDKPKLRLTIPLKELLSPDEWLAVSRITASYIDSTMEIFDPSMFRSAQLMFWPSLNSDSEYIFNRNATGVALDGKKVLAGFPGWEDLSQLPRKEDETLAQHGKPVADPLEKEGIIGAFNRSHSISDVIQTWLSDIYEEAETSDGTSVRYTYKLGSSFGGVRIYDDKLLWSDHATDPATGHQQNAFDLLRIHKFGDQDSQAEDGSESVSSRPSYKAMRKFALTDPDTKAELALSSYDVSQVLDDQSEEVAESPEDEDRISDDEPEKDWLARLDMNEKLDYKPSFYNLDLILRHDKRFKDLIGFNELMQKPVLLRRWRAKTHKIDYPKPPEDGREWTDVMTTQMQSILDSPRGQGMNGFNISVGVEKANASVDRVAAHKSFHPVREYLNSLTWDGVPRVEQLFVKYLGADDTAYSRETAKLMMVAAVARAMHPGCKYDYVVILEGKQGIRKSTFFRALCSNPWFGELRGDYGDPKKLEEIISGSWIVEIPDLAHFNLHDAEIMKALFSAQHDKVRRAFARRSETYRRNIIFVATTNKEEYLKDPTGNRRYLPVKVHALTIDIPELKTNRDQLWAEATRLFREMDTDTPPGEDFPLYIDNPEANAMALELQQHREIDEGHSALAERIARWANTPVSPQAAEPGFDAGIDDEDTTAPKVLRSALIAADIFRYCLNGDTGKYGRTDIARIGTAMRLLEKHWGRRSQSRTLIPGRKVAYYCRIIPSDKELDI